MIDPNHERYVKRVRDLGIDIPIGTFIADAVDILCDRIEELERLVKEHEDGLRI